MHCAIGMPRRPLHNTGGMVFHVMNRGSRRGVLFDDPRDYAAFVAVLREADERVPMRLLAIALMRNHFHLVLWPFEDGDLQEYMRWLLTTHACRWHTAHGTRGTWASYQGRYLAIPVQNESHLLIVCRYVEQNPVRAGLVGRASEWRWSSASARPGAPLPPLAEWPVSRRATGTRSSMHRRPPRRPRRCATACIGTLRSGTQSGVRICRRASGGGPAFVHPVVRERARWNEVFRNNTGSRFSAKQHRELFLRLARSAR
jgi:putative transposase